MDKVNAWGDRAFRPLIPQIQKKLAECLTNGLAIGTMVVTSKRGAAWDRSSIG